MYTLFIYSGSGWALKVKRQSQYTGNCRFNPKWRVFLSIISVLGIRVKPGSTEDDTVQAGLLDVTVAGVTSCFRYRDNSRH